MARDPLTNISAYAAGLVRFMLHVLFKMGVAWTTIHAPLMVLLMLLAHTRLSQAAPKGKRMSKLLQGPSGPAPPPPVPFWDLARCKLTADMLTCMLEPWKPYGSHLA